MAHFIAGSGGKPRKSLGMRGISKVGAPLLSTYISSILEDRRPQTTNPLKKGRLLQTRRVSSLYTVHFLLDSQRRTCVVAQREHGLQQP